MLSIAVIYYQTPSLKLLAYSSAHFAFALDDLPPLRHHMGV